MSLYYATKFSLLSPLKAMNRFTLENVERFNGLTRLSIVPRKFLIRKQNMPYSGLKKSTCCPTENNTPIANDSMVRLVERRHHCPIIS